MRFRACILALLFALFSCRSAANEPNLYQQHGLYPQDFKTPIAVLIHERNGQPFYMASAFLINKEQGIFVTAKHFVDYLDGSDFKMFFNGKVYSGLVAVTPSTSDLALVGIEATSFSSADFPEGLVLAKSQLKVGDLVRVFGMHLHPISLQANQVLVGILRGYYNMPGEQREFVFDQLEAKVSNLAVEVKNKDIDGMPEEFGLLSNTYIEIITTKDHQFSFAGLSGGPVVNEKNEVIGVLAHGQGSGQVFFEPFGVYKPWKILRLVPSEELQKITNNVK